MNVSPAPAAVSQAADAKPGVFHCGTLTYTRVSLIALFAWLLWGDFCYTLMETVVPSVLPLRLKDLGCSNLVLSLIISTIPGILNMTICPYVSFKSDRFRSRWGRRIPFIICTMPFLCLCLAMLGWSDEVTIFLRTHVAWFCNYAPATLTIAVIGFFMTLFTFFNMFVASVFWYLFNDVVPAQFLARFVGLFRIVGTAAGALYSYFIFEFARSNMREILLGAAVLYLIGFGLVCFMIKEGQYPPLEDKAPEQEKKSKLHVVKAFAAESFSNKFYWLVFSLTAIQTATGAINVFTVFFNQNMGLTLRDIGRLGTITMIAAMAAMYFTAIFIDRWHPVRVSVYMVVLSLAGTVMSWVWVFVSLPSQYYFWLTVGIGLVAAFQAALAGGASFPRDMRVFPHSRFGQFCSSQALFRSFCTLIAGLLAGVYMDVIKRFCAVPDFSYRFIFAWNTVFTIALIVIALLLYRHWYKLGGDAHYHPPASWSETGKEELPIVTTVGPQSRWVNIMLRLYHAIMLLSVLLIIPLMLWMRAQHMNTAFYWHATVLLPAAFVLWLYWCWVERGIRMDMKRSRNGEPLKNGIPHHGCTIVIAIQFLLMIPIWITQVVVTVNHQIQHGAIVFTTANLITNLILITSIWILARAERGHLTQMDVNLAEAAD